MSSPEQNPEDLLRQALDGVDLSQIGQGKEAEYPTIQPDEISEAMEHDPMRGWAMRLANENLKEARAQAEGTQPRKRKVHEAGWSLAIETPRGHVGLWSCWLKNQFYLGFPKSTARVINSAEPFTLRAVANHIRNQNLPRTAMPWQREPLDFDGAKSYLGEMSDPELRATFKEYGIVHRDQPYIEVTDDLITQTLGAERAKPVRQVSGVAVNDWNYRGEFADPDKPFEQNEVGQIIAFQDQGERLWAMFYGPIEPAGGRVWVDYKGFNSNGFHFPYIDEKGQLQSLYCGHDQSNSISTAQFSFYNKYAPEGPTADSESIQKYRDRFIRLAAEISFIMGGPKAISINYGYSMVPEDLHREGYAGITWLKGEYGERKGWGEDVVRGNKGDSTVILKSANSLVPWTTVLKAPVSGLSSPESLAGFIKEDILWF